MSSSTSFESLHIKCPNNYLASFSFFPRVLATLGNKNVATLSKIFTFLARQLPAAALNCPDTGSARLGLSSAVS